MKQLFCAGNCVQVTMAPSQQTTLPARSRQSFALSHKLYLHTRDKAPPPHPPYCFFFCWRWRETYSRGIRTLDELGGTGYHLCRSSGLSPVRMQCWLRPKVGTEQVKHKSAVLNCTLDKTEPGMYSSNICCIWDYWVHTLKSQFKWVLTVSVPGKVIQYVFFKKKIES